jgi:hypothetical protein
MKRLNLWTWSIDLENDEELTTVIPLWQPDKQIHIMYVLGEIIAAEFLGIKYKPSGNGNVDLSDSFGTTYQVKTTKNKINYRYLFLDDSGLGAVFDKYIFIIFNEDMSKAEIKNIVDTDIAFFNSKQIILNGKRKRVWYFKENTSSYSNSITNKEINKAKEIYND